MKFRIRPSRGVKRMNGAEAPCVKTDWFIHRGDHVTLRPESDGLLQELTAEVLEAEDEFLLVRALHDLDIGGERAASAGDTFLVRRACVHAVCALSGVGVPSYLEPVLEA